MKFRVTFLDGVDLLIEAEKEVDAVKRAKELKSKVSDSVVSGNENDIEILLNYVTPSGGFRTDILSKDNESISDKVKRYAGKLKNRFASITVKSKSGDYQQSYYADGTKSKALNYSGSRYKG